MQSKKSKSKKSKSKKSDHPRGFANLRSRIAGALARVAAKRKNSGRPDKRTPSSLPRKAKSSRLRNRKSPRTIYIPHPKIRGEWVELRFMTRAIEFRFRVLRNWGDSAPYDVVTEYRRRFRRIQVKCTVQKRWNSYRCHLDHNGQPYSPKDIDFIAAGACPERSRRIIPTDTWYILPIRAIKGQTDILLTPDNPNAKYEKYREAWHLLKR